MSRTVKTTRSDFLNELGVVVPEVTEVSILGFFGPYGFLSNFHPATVELDGLVFKSSEAAYMSLKTVDPEQKRHLTTLTAAEAKKYGTTVVTLIPDWENRRDEAMERVVYAKFSQNDAIKRLLKETDPKHLEETNWWGDIYWGVCGGIGQNKLGRTLMRVRGYV